MRKGFGLLSSGTYTLKELWGVPAAGCAQHTRRDPERARKQEARRHTTYA